MKPPGRQTILGSGKEAAEAVYGTNGEERREELHPKPLNQREMKKKETVSFFSEFSGWWFKQPEGKELCFLFGSF